VSAERIKELQRQRFQYLNKLYETVDGREDRYASYEKVGEEFGFDKDLSYRIAEYLKGEFLLEFVTLGGGIKITHFGIQEVEQALAEPDQSTTHFMPVNVINIGTMTNSQIQQGSNNSIQTQIIDQDKIPAIQEFIQKLSNSMEELGLEENDKNDLSVEIDTAKTQLQSSKPKKNILQECFMTIKNILERAASSALASELSESLSNISF